MLCARSAARLPSHTLLLRLVAAVQGLQGVEPPNGQAPARSGELVAASLGKKEQQDLVAQQHAELLSKLPYDQQMVCVRVCVRICVCLHACEPALACALAAHC